MDAILFHSIREMSPYVPKLGIRKTKLLVLPSMLKGMNYLHTQHAKSGAAHHFCLLFSLSKNSSNTP